MNVTQLEMMENGLKRIRYWQNKVRGLFCEEKGFQGLNYKKPGA
jgi:hypothetical protein